MIGIKDSEGVNFENQVLLNSKNKINYFPLYIKVSLIKKNENWNNERKGHLKGPTAWFPWVRETRMKSRGRGKAIVLATANARGSTKLIKVIRGIHELVKKCENELEGKKTEMKIVWTRNCE